jgi:hypothetical protein
MSNNDNTQEPDSGMPDGAVNVVPATLPTPEEPTMEMDLSEPQQDLSAEQAPVVAKPAAEDELDDKPTITPLAPLAPSTTVRQEFETFFELGKVAWNDDAETLPIPETTTERIDQALTAFPNEDIAASEQGREWAATLEQSGSVLTRKAYFGEAMEREGSNWRQTVTGEKGNLHAAFPSFKDEPGAKITGERAMLRVRALVGLGSMIHVPLWHSGFWITLKAPPESEMLNLHARLAEEKIALGRQTWGLSFANNSVFLAGWVTDFILANSFGTTLKDPNDLRSKISSLDIPTLIWGIASVIWPRGFQYARSVLDQSGEQYQIVKERLNIPKLFWTDTSTLTPWQISHMGNRHGQTMSPESVARYRDEFTRGKGRLVSIHENVKVMLRVPSLDQYLNSGQKWVNNIVAMVDRAFAMKNEDQLRDAYIMDQGKATNMRQFAHWVEYIDADGRIIEDEATIESTFDALSSSDEMRGAFFEEVRKFMEDSTVSVVAVPAASEEDRKRELPRFPHLLPIDALSVFFILLVQKIRIIRSRP